MARKKKIAEPVVIEEGSTGITVEQHLRDLGLLIGNTAMDQPPLLPPVDNPINIHGFGPVTAAGLNPEYVAEEETFEVTLFDRTDIQVNGHLQHLPGGNQKVSKQIYNILRDANLITI